MRSIVSTETRMVSWLWFFDLSPEASSFSLLGAFAFGGLGLRSSRCGGCGCGGYGQQRRPRDLGGRLLEHEPVRG